MKAIYQFKLHLIVSIIFVSHFTGCVTKTNINMDDMAKTQDSIKALAFNAPTTNEELNFIKRGASDAYRIKNLQGALFSPVMIEPTINILDIYNYYVNNNQNGRYKGIRFYPAVKNKKLSFIICLAEGDTHKVGERGYIILEEAHYHTSGTLTLGQNEIDRDSALKYHKEFMDSVLIFSKAQKLPAAPYDTIRISRFYKWDDLLKLINQNMTEGNMANNYFQIDFGYVLPEMADKLKNRATSFKIKELHQGFTTLIYLKNPQGIASLDPFSRYDDGNENERDNYRGRALEVGHPCPPVCGELHPNP